MSCKKFIFKEQQIVNSQKIYDSKLDIFVYIKNMILLDIIRNTMIDDDNQKIFDFLSRCIYYQNEKYEKKEMFYKYSTESDLLKN